MRSTSLARFVGTAFACSFAAAVAADPTAAPMAGEALASPAPVEAAAPLPPDAAALRAGLDGALAGLPAGEAAAISGFFAGRDYAPFWTESGSDRAAALGAALDDAGAQALPVRSDAIATLTRLFGPSPDAADAAEREVAATRAYLGFARDVSRGVVAPGSVYPEIQDRPAAQPPAALLARLNGGPLPDVLAGLQPADPDYARLVAEKARLELLAQGASWGPEVAQGPTLHPGEDDPRVAALRARLARLGYVVPTDAAAGTGFDASLQQAVEAFQRDYGLNDDGVVGAMTLEAVNAPAETRLAQVAVNLERLRWLNRAPDPRMLLVNIPDFTVRLIDGGTTVWQSKVVVGKTNVTETPEFSGVVKYMVVNPTWHIPDSIAIRDYLPKLQKDPMVLKRQNIRLLTRYGTEINPRLVDFTQYTPENFPFRIKQRPSDDNALGKVKFLFPNQNSVYMHDTPHRELFARDVRAFSNGCIRLEKPTELANIVMEGQVPDPAASFDAWVAAKKEKTITLERTIPVRIVYRTVWFDDAGGVHYRPDVYGRDAKVFAALAAAGLTLPAAQG